VSHREGEGKLISGSIDGYHLLASVHAVASGTGGTGGSDTVIIMPISDCTC
jgi:hypothetical protein